MQTNEANDPTLIASLLDLVECFLDTRPPLEFPTQANDGAPSPLLGQGVKGSPLRFGSFSFAYFRQSCLGGGERGRRVEVVQMRAECRRGQVVLSSARVQKACPMA